MIRNLIISCLLLCTSLQAHEELTTDSMLEIEKKVEAQIAKYKAHKVLLVLDIDNTILTAPQDLGSDQWFTWQEENCLQNKVKPDFCVANNFDELLNIQGKIFALSNMVPTEDHTVAVIKRLQKKDIKMILLTSRGPGFRNATEESLAKNGLHFIHHAIGPKKGYAGTYSPYEVKNPAKYGLNKDDMQAINNQNPRPVSFMNGIFMTAGLNKGVMLKSLLHKTKTDVSAIIFADDHEKHTKRMQKIFASNKKIDLTTYRYSKLDPVVNEFKKSDKRKVMETWTKFKNLTFEIFAQ